MSSAVELHDSVVTGVKVHEGNVVVRFSPAYLHRSKGSPGIDTGEVFTLDLDIVLDSATIHKPFTELPCELQGGTISTAGERFENCIPYPLNKNKPISAKLVDIYGREVHIDAQSITLRAASPEEYIESFPSTR